MLQKQQSDVDAIEEFIITSLIYTSAKKTLENLLTSVVKEKYTLEQFLNLLRNKKVVSTIMNQLNETIEQKLSKYNIRKKGYSVDSNILIGMLLNREVKFYNNPYSKEINNINKPEYDNITVSTENGTKILSFYRGNMYGDKIIFDLFPLLPFIELREDQINFLFNIRNKLINNTDTILYNLPTGWGKTRLMQTLLMINEQKGSVFNTIAIQPTATLSKIMGQILNVTSIEDVEENDFISKPIVPSIMENALPSIYQKINELSEGNNSFDIMINKNPRIEDLQKTHKLYNKNTDICNAVIESIKDMAYMLSNENGLICCNVSYCNISQGKDVLCTIKSKTDPEVSTSIPHEVFATILMYHHNKEIVRHAVNLLCIAFNFSDGYNITDADIQNAPDGDPLRRLKTAVDKYKKSESVSLNSSSVFSGNGLLKYLEVVFNLSNDDTKNKILNRFISSKFIIDEAHKNEYNLLNLFLANDTLFEKYKKEILSSKNISQSRSEGFQSLEEGIKCVENLRSKVNCHNKEFLNQLRQNLILLTATPNLGLSVSRFMNEDKINVIKKIADNDSKIFKLQQRVSGAPLSFVPSNDYKDDDLILPDYKRAVLERLAAFDFNHYKKLNSKIIEDMLCLDKIKKEYKDYGTDATNKAIIFLDNEKDIIRAYQYEYDIADNIMQLDAEEKKFLCNLFRKRRIEAIQQILNKTRFQKETGTDPSRQLVLPNQTLTLTECEKYIKQIQQWKDQDILEFLKNSMIPNKVPEKYDNNIITQFITEMEENRQTLIGKTDDIGTGIDIQKIQIGILVGRSFESLCEQLNIKHNVELKKAYLAYVKSGIKPKNMDFKKNIEKIITYLNKNPYSIDTIQQAIGRVARNAKGKHFGNFVMMQLGTEYNGIAGKFGLVAVSNPQALLFSSKYDIDKFNYQQAVVEELESKDNGYFFHTTLLNRYPGIDKKVFRKKVLTTLQNLKHNNPSQYDILNIILSSSAVSDMFGKCPSGMNKEEWRKQKEQSFNNIINNSELMKLFADANQEQMKKLLEPQTLTLLIKDKNFIEFLEYVGLNDFMDNAEEFQKKYNILVNDPKIKDFPISLKARIFNIINLAESNLIINLNTHFVKHQPHGEEIANTLMQIGDIYHHNPKWYTGIKNFLDGVLNAKAIGEFRYMSEIEQKNFLYLLQAIKDNGIDNVKTLNKFFQQLRIEHLNKYYKIIPNITNKEMLNAFLDQPLNTFSEVLIQNFELNQSKLPLQYKETFFGLSLKSLYKISPEYLKDWNNHEELKEFLDMIGHSNRHIKNKEEMKKFLDFESKLFKIDPKYLKIFIESYNDKHIISSWYANFLYDSIESSQNDAEIHELFNKDKFKLHQIRNKIHLLKCGIDFNTIVAIENASSKDNTLKSFGEVLRQIKESDKDFNPCLTQKQINQKSLLLFQEILKLPKKATLYKEIVNKIDLGDQKNVEKILNLLKVSNQYKEIDILEFLKYYNTTNAHLIISVLAKENLLPQKKAPATDFLSFWLKNTPAEKENNNSEINKVMSYADKHPDKFSDLSSATFYTKLLFSETIKDVDKDSIFQSKNKFQHNTNEISESTLRFIESMNGQNALFVFDAICETDQSLLTESKIQKTIELIDRMQDNSQNFIEFISNLKNTTKSSVLFNDILNTESKIDALMQVYNKLKELNLLHEVNVLRNICLNENFLQLLTKIQNTDNIVQVLNIIQNNPQYIDSILQLDPIQINIWSQDTQKNPAFFLDFDISKKKSDILLDKKNLDDMYQVWQKDPSVISKVEMYIKNHDDCNKVYKLLNNVNKNIFEYLAINLQKSNFHFFIKQLQRNPNPETVDCFTPNIEWLPTEKLSKIACIVDRQKTQMQNNKNPLTIKKQKTQTQNNKNPLTIKKQKIQPMFQVPNNNFKKIQLKSKLTQKQ